MRQALNYALDRETFTRALIGEYGSPTSQLLTIDGFDPDYQDHYPYDPEKARQLLAEAGYPDGFTFKVVSPTWNGITGDPLARAIAQNLSDVGITMDITPAVSIADYFPKVVSGDFPVILLKRGGDPMAFFHSLFLADDALLNITHGVDPEMEDLLARGQVAPEDEAAEIWNEMSRRTVTEGHFVPALLYHEILYVNTDKVGNVELTDARAYAPLTTDWEPAEGDGT